MTYQKQWTERDNNVVGYVYMVEAVGFNGWLPGRLLRRGKIGLTRNVQKRLDEFHTNQPPCDIRVIKTIYVQNMAAVETEIHQKFKHCNVKLLKSREWFDFNPWQFQRCLMMMNHHDSERQPFTFSTRLVVGSAIALSGLGLLVHESLPSTPTAASRIEVSRQQATTSPHPNTKTRKFVKGSTATSNH